VVFGIGPEVGVGGADQAGNGLHGAISWPGKG